MESKLRERRHRAEEQKRPDQPVVKGGLGGTSIRVLLVDDNAGERALVSHQLRTEIPNLQIVEAGDQPSFAAALERGAFDALVTDYHLGWTDGLRVLASVNERWPDVPVVMFTGTGNEEVAVEAMKAGVFDYVLKEPKSYPRLRAAIKAALEDRESKRKRTAAEIRYKELFDTVPVALFKCTPHGQILDANPAFSLLIGTRDRRELIGRKFSDLHPSAEDFRTWREKLERDGAVAFIEGHFKTSDGAIRSVEIHAKALRDPDTGQIYYEGSIEDVTARKQAEAERERLISELQSALGDVKMLKGLLPICASCKKIRDGKGHWNMLESYIENHSQAHFTHSFCPECAHRLYPEVFLDTPKI